MENKETSNKSNMYSADLCNKFLVCGELSPFGSFSVELADEPLGTVVLVLVGVEGADL